MKKILAIVMISLICLSTFSILAPQVTAQQETNIIFSDDFERSVLAPWFQVDGYASYGGETWQGTGTVAIENGELSIITDSYWYNVYGVCTFDATDVNFELSVIAKIMADSAPSTNFGMGIGEFSGVFEEAEMRQLEFGYNGYYQEWVISGTAIDYVERVSWTPIDLGDWTKMTIKKLGDSYEFYVNDQLILSRSGPNFSQVNYVSLENGVGVHWEGGTHVHYDNVLLRARGHITFPWRDDFDYDTLDEMKVAGWSLVGEHLIEVGGGTVALTNDGVTGPGVSYVGNFPLEIYDFEAECAGMRIGTTTGGLGIDIYTERHVYSWGADGWTSDYRFHRDGVLVLDIGGYASPPDTWETFCFKKIGNKIDLYYNSELKGTYIDPDETHDALTGVGMHSGWLITAKYDYISVEVPTHADFEISVLPEYAIADPHSITQFEVTVISFGGFTQPVTLSAVFSSHELSGTFEDTVVTPPSDGSITTTLKGSVSSEALNTHYTYITGVSDELSHTKTVSLHVPFMSVPFLSQGDAEWCLPTSLAMAMDFWGKNIKPWEVAEVFGIGHDKGLSMHDHALDIKQYIVSQGLGYLFEYNLDESRLESLLGYGPVVLAVNWTSDSEQMFHAVVMTGFDNDEFFINDPSGALLDELFFPQSAPDSHMQIGAKWTDLSHFVNFERDPEAICITGTGSISLQKGLLNLVGGKKDEIRTVRADHAGITGPYIWESGGVTFPGETSGITWQFASHQRSLDPYDKLFIAEGLTDTNNGLIVNPTNSWMDYEFHVILEHPSLIYDRYCHVRIEPCGIANPGFDTIDLGEALGSHYGQYQITLQLFDSQDSLIDKIELPKIRYRPFVRISAHSPVNLYITDPQGLSIGTDPDTGQHVNEIPDAFYSGPGTEPQVVMIPDPTDGNYEVLLIGTATGTYSLTTELIFAEGTVTQTFAGETVEGAVFVYSVSIVDEVMTANPNPAAELEHLKQFIEELPDDVFDKPKLANQRKKALFDKIDEVILKVEAGNYTDAIHKLFHDIRAKIDGDSTAEDWIIYPETQSRLCVIIDHTISSIEALQD